MADIERAVLAALAELQDADTDEEQTANAVARRAGVKFAVASMTLDRLLHQGLVAHRPRPHFPFVRVDQSVESALYTITRRGRERLAE